MAFNANVVVIRTPFRPGTPEGSRVSQGILAATNAVLRSYGLSIVQRVERSEYDNHTMSKEVNRYIRVKQKKVEGEPEQKEAMVKVGSGKYNNEAFASAKYGFFSISAMGEYTVIWHSFHSRLHKVIPEFNIMTVRLAQALSTGNQLECMVLQATSFSRQKDLFVMFVNGRERNTLSGKGALTEVKNTYGVDINKLMDNIDQNLAIYYAPIDFAEVKRDLDEQKKRYDAFVKHATEVNLENREDGTNMMAAFQKENEQTMADLQQRYSVVELAMKSNPMGDVVFFKMDQDARFRATPEEERSFGRKVDLPAE